MGTRHRGSATEIRALDVFIKLMRAADSLTADLSRHVSDNSLTLGQFGVLEALLHLGPLSQVDLGGKLLRSGSNVTMLIDNLQKRGLVRRTRRNDDRRVIDVSLTDAGRDIITALFPTHARRIVQLFGALSPAQQEHLAELCRTLGRGVAQTKEELEERIQNKEFGI